MALGASRRDVAWSFVKRGTVLAGTGAAIGVIAALALSGAMQSMLYGVGPRDAFSFGSGVAVVMVIALLASGAPAWRAAKTDPLSALRHQ